MYSYTYIAHNRPNNNVSTPNPLVPSDALFTSVTPSEVTGSVQNQGVPVTFTFTGSFIYADVPTTADALVSGALSGTLSSKSVYVNGALSFEETWAEGTVGYLATLTSHTNCRNSLAMIILKAPVRLGVTTRSKA